MTAEQVYTALRSLDSHEQIDLGTRILNDNDLFFHAWMPQDMQYVAKDCGYYMDVDTARDEIKSAIDNVDAEYGVNWDHLRNSFSAEGLEDYDPTKHDSL